MIDLAKVRDEPAQFDEAMRARGVAMRAELLLQLDAEQRAGRTRLEKLRAARNNLARQIGAAKKQGEDAALLLEEAESLRIRLKETQKQAEEQTKRLRAAMFEIPNLPDASVPVGPDESFNREERRWGEAKEMAYACEHFDIPACAEKIDFESAARLSGSRFSVLFGEIARLERALGAFMLDMHTKKFGYCEVSVPLMVRDEALEGTGQLPKFADDLFRVESGYWLIPTAEVSLTNLVRAQILPVKKLPLRYCALSPCFRAEAGAAGRDTRGLIRQHQFYKVELVSVTQAEQSDAELERMVGCAQKILEALGLAYRTLTLSSGDMGFSARKTYDIEVWLPGARAYREISSCSNCGDFQARRMMARCKDATQGSKPIRFVHTLNGSGLAVGRCLIAVVENYQQKDGSVIIPEVLRPYMGGADVISV